MGGIITGLLQSCEVGLLWKSQSPLTTASSVMLTVICTRFTFSTSAVTPLAVKRNMSLVCNIAFQTNIPPKSILRINEPSI